MHSINLNNLLQILIHFYEIKKWLEGLIQIPNLAQSNGWMHIAVALISNLVFFFLSFIYFMKLRLKREELN